MAKVSDPARRCIWLFSQAYALLYRRQVRESLRLTPQGQGLLQHLAYAGPLTIGEISLHVGRAQSVVSETVDVLVSHQLLERVRDPRDKRRTLVWLTDKGLDWLAREQEPLDRDRTSSVLAALEPKERMAFLEGFEAFIRVADELRRRELAPALVSLDPPGSNPEKKE